MSYFHLWEVQSMHVAKQLNISKVCKTMDCILSSTYSLCRTLPQPLTNLWCMRELVTEISLVQLCPIIVIVQFCLQDTLSLKENLFQLLPGKSNREFRQMIMRPPHHYFLMSGKARGRLKLIEHCNRYYLVIFIKTVIHEASNNWCLSNSLIAQKYKFIFCQGRNIWCRASGYCLTNWITSWWGCRRWGHNLYCRWWKLYPDDRICLSTIITNIQYDSFLHQENSSKCSLDSLCAVERDTRNAGDAN